MLEILTSNWDLLVLGTVIILTVIIGFIVFFKDQNSPTNRSFLGFALLTALWGLFNFFSYRVSDADTAFLLLKFTIFTVTWQTYYFLKFTLDFPKTKPVSWNIYKRILLIVVAATSVLTLTPLVFESIKSISETGVIAEINYGPAIPLFGNLTIGLTLAGIIILLRKTLKITGDLRRAYTLISVGALIMFVLIIMSNFVFPVLFGNSTYLPFGALFVFPFIILTSYTILKNNVFNVRVISSEIFTVILLLLSLVQLAQSQEISEIILRGAIFITFLIVGVFLIKGVIREVKQREQIEALASNLKKANTRLKELDRLKSEFVSIASHQLRSPLTAIKGYASLILEGSFGKINIPVQEAVQKIFDSSSLMAVSVQDFLDVSRIEQGKMKYNFEDFDLQNLLTTVVEELHTVAATKGLKLNLDIAKDDPYTIHADLGKIKQVLHNLIDNSIKYTPKGSVTVKLYKIDEKVKIEITDTGVGISKETLSKLFDKFIRSRNAHHVNVSGTGLGLFVVKQMVEAHKGRVWATSDGEGKGSTFHVELLN